MPSSKHTEGRLVVEPRQPGCFNLTIGPLPIAFVSTATVCLPGGHMLDLNTVHVSLAQSEANAARLVACWNACEGIEDPDDLSGYSEALAALRTERDELLEALRKIEWGAEREGEGGLCPDCFESRRDGHREDCDIRAAIAKAEGREGGDE